TLTAKPILLLGGASSVIDGVHFGPHRQRQPEARVFVADSEETTPHHTDHHKWFIVQQQSLTYDVLGAAETRLPQLMAYDYNRFPARRADLFLRECAAANRLDAEYREVIAGYKFSRPLFHLGRGGLASQQKRLDGAGHQARIDLSLIAEENIVG